MPDSMDQPPDWGNNESWDEFEWERALKYSDQLASKYFGLLERFADLPDAEALIAERLGEINLLELDEAEIYSTDFEQAWSEDDEDEDGDEIEEEDEAEFEEGGEEGPEERTLQPGDSLYYESMPVYQQTRQLALGWCNIQASFMEPKDRLWGLRILVFFGRMLAFLALSIGDGTFQRVEASLAFGKRALSLINSILGEMEAKSGESRQYQANFSQIRSRLFKIREAIIEFMQELRKKQSE